MPLMSRIALSSSKKHAEASLQILRRYGSVRRYRSSSRELRNCNKPSSLPEQAAAPTSCRSLEKEQYFRALALKKEVDILQNEIRKYRKILDEIGDAIRDAREEMLQSKMKIDVMDKKYENMTRLMGHVTFYGFCAALAYRAWF